MSPLPQINILASLFQESTDTKGASSKDIKSSLFKDLLKKNIDQSPKGDWGYGLFSGSGLDAKSETQKSGVKSNTIDDLTRALNHLGIPANQLYLPAQMAGKLAQVLKNQGWDQKEIDQLLAAVKDKQGNILLNKLMEKLQQARVNQEQGKEQLLIASKDIPGVEELLFKTGLGAGQVKNLLEKATTQKGELSLEKLSQALSDLSGKQVALKDLHELLKLNQINTKPQINGLEKQAQQLLSESGGPSGSDSQNGLKNALAQALIDKGISAQEVKTLLEKMSFDYTRTKGSAGPGATLLPDHNDLQKQLNELLKGAVVKTQNMGQAEANAQTILETTKKGIGGKAKGQESIGKFAGDLLAAEEENTALPQTLKGKINAVESILNSGNDPLLKTKGDPAEEIIKGLRKLNNQNESTAELGLANGAGAKRLNTQGLESSQANSSRSAYDLPQPLPKVLERLIWMVQAGEQKSRLSISPPELGKLDLEIVMKQGHLQANLSAENSTVKELIEANLGQLRQQLSDQGVIVDQFQVTVGLNQYSLEHERLSAEEQFPRGSSRSKEEIKEVNSLVEPAAQVTVKNGLYQVDLHV
jgi:flagellar hook-length control protein FliK